MGPYGPTIECHGHSSSSSLVVKCHVDMGTWRDTVVRVLMMAGIIAIHLERAKNHSLALVRDGWFSRSFHDGEQRCSTAVTIFCFERRQDRFTFAFGNV